MTLVAFVAPLALSVLVFAATLRLSPRGADATHTPRSRGSFPGRRRVD